MADEGTRLFDDSPASSGSVRDVLRRVYDALGEKGYDPVDQLVGYLLSGEPAYITGYKGARSAIGRIERHDVLEELVRFYVTDEQSRSS